MRNLLVLLFVVLMATSCNFAVLDDEGNVISWWITLKVESGYPAGELRVTQLKGDNDYSSLTFMREYEGEEVSMLVRVKNYEQYDELYGQLEVYICPEDQPGCNIEDAAHSFGIVEVTEGTITL